MYKMEPIDRRTVHIRNAKANVNVILPENETFKNILKTEEFFVINLSKKTSVFVRRHENTTPPLYDYFAEVTDTGLYYDEKFSDNVERMLTLIGRERGTFAYVSGYNEFYVCMSVIAEPYNGESEHLTIIHNDFNDEIITKTTISMKDMTDRICEIVEKIDNSVSIT